MRTKAPDRPLVLLWGMLHFSQPPLDLAPVFCRIGADLLTPLAPFCFRFGSDLSISNQHENGKVADPDQPVKIICNNEDRDPDRPDKREDEKSQKGGPK